MATECQCEDSDCYYGANPCRHAGYIQVTPSYLMCGTCATAWMLREARERENLGPVPQKPKAGGVTLNRSIYSRWDITSLPKGKAHIRYETNDNDDDGCPDPGPVTVWEKDTTMSIARDVTGVSRIGYYGQAVDVYLDGKKT